MYLSKKLNMPMPSNINIWWNTGSMLGLILMIQITTGFILSMNYCPSTKMAFQSVIHIDSNTFMGWLAHNAHINGASLFFMMMLTHIMRGLFYMSFKLPLTWMIGIFILLLSMASAFLGYVLPWGQMSFWGATVITNLLSAIPYFGPLCVEWIWGGFSINNATLNRFFSLHFILPLMISALVLAHIMSLHQTGSNNPLGTQSQIMMIPFNPYFTVKDYIGFIAVLFLITALSTQYPLLLTDPDNFSIANPMTTPIHIKPEWYFLFAYSILRSIPNKLGGVICMLASILILLTMILTKTSMSTLKFYPPTSFCTWIFLNILILLSWTGSKPISYPFPSIAQALSILYFSYFLSFPLICQGWEKMLK